MNLITITYNADKVNIHIQVFLESKVFKESHLLHKIRIKLETITEECKKTKSVSND